MCFWKWLNRSREIFVRYLGAGRNDVHLQGWLVFTMIRKERWPEEVCQRWSWVTWSYTAYPTEAEIVLTNCVRVALVTQKRIGNTKSDSARNSARNPDNSRVNGDRRFLDWLRVIDVFRLFAYGVHVALFSNCYRVWSFEELLKQSMQLFYYMITFFTYGRGRASVRKRKSRKIPYGHSAHQWLDWSIFFYGNNWL